MLSAPIGDPEWRRWSNVDDRIYVRQGISLEEMTSVQRDAAFDLMRESLSAKGLQLSLDIMKTDQTLREINNDELRYGEQNDALALLQSLDEEQRNAAILGVDKPGVASRHS